MSRPWESNAAKVFAALDPNTGGCGCHLMPPCAYCVAHSEAAGCEGFEDKNKEG